MFKDARSKKVVLVAHCILNQNSISDGTADFQGTFKEIAEVLVKSNVGILQLPCPELMCLGLDRGNIHGAEQPVVAENTRIRKSLSKKYSVQKLKKLVEYVIYQIEEYYKNGFSIIGIIGVNRSPSCGVDTTTNYNMEIGGEGIFIKAIYKKLKSKNIKIKTIGIKSTEIKKSILKVKSLLNKKSI